MKTSLLLLMPYMPQDKLLTHLLISINYKPLLLLKISEYFLTRMLAILELCEIVSAVKNGALTWQ